MRYLSINNKNLLSNRCKFNFKKFKNTKNNLLFSIKNEINQNNIFDENHYKCIICNNNNFITFSEIDRNLFPVNFSLCKKCGLINSNIHFDIKFQKLYYSKYYNNFKKKNYEKNFIRRIKKDSFSFNRYNFIINNLGNNINKVKIVFEPGCNDGANLYPFKINNYRVFGSDYDKNSIKTGKKYGLNLINGGFEQLLNLNLKADLIILSHLIAHVPDLDSFFILLKKITHNNTIVYIETPSILSWVQKNKNKNIISNIYKSNNNILSFLQLDFCYIFSSSTLEKLLSKYGFVKIYSDEIIRSLYKISKNVHLTNNEDDLKNNYKNTFNHLLNVEKEYNNKIKYFINFFKKLFYFIKV